MYAWEVRGQPDLRELASEVWSDLRVAPPARERARRLVDYAAGHLAELDAHLTAVTSNWRLERLGVIERNLLRLAGAELALADQPPKVVLQEWIRLAERFGTSASARFVNGVLDALARRMGRL